jgi:hypothetical protein
MRFHAKALPNEWQGSTRNGLKSLPSRLGLSQIWSFSVPGNFPRIFWKSPGWIPEVRSQMSTSHRTFLGSGLFVHYLVNIPVDNLLTTSKFHYWQKLFTKIPVHIVGLWKTETFQTGQIFFSILEQGAPVRERVRSGFVPSLGLSLSGNLTFPRGSVVERRNKCLLKENAFPGHGAPLNYTYIITYTYI